MDLKSLYLLVNSVNATIREGLFAQLAFAQGIRNLKLSQIKEKL